MSASILWSVYIILPSRRWRHWSSRDWSSMQLVSGRGVIWTWAPWHLRPEYCTTQLTAGRLSAQSPIPVKMGDVYSSRYSSPIGLNPPPETALWLPFLHPIRMAEPQSRGAQRSCGPHLCCTDGAHDSQRLAEPGFEIWSLDSLSGALSTVSSTSLKTEKLMGNEMP